MRRACARALSPRSFFLLLLEHRFQPTTSPLCGLASWPLLGACSMYPGEKFLNRHDLVDLTSPGSSVSEKLPLQGMSFAVATAGTTPVFPTSAEERKKVPSGIAQAKEAYNKGSF